MFAKPLAGSGFTASMQTDRTFLDLTHISHRSPAVRHRLTD